MPKVPEDLATAYVAVGILYITGGVEIGEQKSGTLRLSSHAGLAKERLSGTAKGDKIAV